MAITSSTISRTKKNQAFWKPVSDTGPSRGNFMTSHTMRQTMVVHEAPCRSARHQVAALGELDVQAAQVGLQPGVLHGDQVRGLIGLVEVRVPHARRRGEG